MNNTIFSAIISKLKTLDCLKGSDGTVRIYEYSTSESDGYPFAFVVWQGNVSMIMDNQRDKVTYQYMIRVIQEIFEETGFTPKKGERIARERSYEICSAFREDNGLGVAGVLRTTPINVDKGYINNGNQIVIDITLEVETVENVI